jgi:hypothetical protein
MIRRAASMNASKASAMCAGDAVTTFPLSAVAFEERPVLGAYTTP